MFVNHISEKPQVFTNQATTVLQSILFHLLVGCCGQSLSLTHMEVVHQQKQVEQTRWTKNISENYEITTSRKLTCPLNRFVWIGDTSCNHWFSADMWVFRGVPTLPEPWFSGKLSAGRYIFIFHWAVSVGRVVLDILCEITTLRKTNMAMENGPFEGVFPIEHGCIHLVPVGQWHTFPSACQLQEIALPQAFSWTGCEGSRDVVPPPKKHHRHAAEGFLKFCGLQPWSAKMPWHTWGEQNREPQRETIHSLLAE